MKKRNKVILLGVALLMFIGSLFSWYSAHKVDARDLAIFHIFVQAVDAETKENLGVAVQSPTPELSTITGNDGQGPVPCLLEMRPVGQIRMAWIDLKNSKASVVLKAEGYQPLRLPPDLIEKTIYFDSLAGSRIPDTVELKKTQPVAGINSVTSLRDSTP